MGLGRWVDQVTELRPTRALRPHLTRLATSLASSADTLMKALVETDPPTLRRRAAALQPSMDEATQVLEGLSRVYHRWSSLTPQDSALEMALVLANTFASDDRPVASILDFARAGVTAAESRLPGVAIPTEIGGACAVMSALSKLYFNEDQFWTTVAWTVAHGRENETNLRVLAQTDSWRTAWLRAIGQAYEAGERLTTLTGAASTDTASVLALIDFTHDMQEGLSKRSSRQHGSSGRTIRRSTNCSLADSPISPTGRGPADCRESRRLKSPRATLEHTTTGISTARKWCSASCDRHWEACAGFR